MKNTFLITLGLALFLLACEKKDETTITQIHPPKSISIVGGNNQTGYPDEYLKDSIVIEITSDNPRDLENYAYYFKSNDYYTDVYAYDSISDSKMVVYVKWRLSPYDVSQNLKFILTEKCNNNQCNKLDSISISATLKSSWIKIFTEESWSGSELYDIHFTDEMNGIVVGDLAFSDGYLKTDDGGNTWNIATNNRNDLYQLAFSDQDTGIVIVTNNYAYFTNDGGQSFYQGEWTPPIIGHRSSSDYFMFSSKEIITVGRDGAIAKSRDGGKNWTTYQGFTFENWLNDITCPEGNICYACGSVGKIIKSNNRGDTWEEKDLPFNNYLKTIYFIDNDFGFTGGQYGALARTTDGGVTWQIIQTELRTTIIEIYFYSKDEGYIVTTTGAIGKTIDGGLTWEIVNKGNYGVNELNKVYFKGNDIFGLQGNSIFKYKLNHE